MRERKNRLEVEKALKHHLRSDKAKVSVGKISKFGLMEMSRQRIRPLIEFGSHGDCPYCKGKGLIPSAETLGLRFLRILKMRCLKHDTKNSSQGQIADGRGGLHFEQKKKRNTGFSKNAP